MIARTRIIEIPAVRGQRVPVAAGADPWAIIIATLIGVVPTAMYDLKDAT